jgi:tetratricopeptide (TPR) repeat protein
MPQGFEANYGLGVLLHAAGATEEAAPFLVRALCVCRDAALRARIAEVLRATPPRAAHPLLELARCQRAAGEAEAAEAWIDQALAADPAAEPDGAAALEAARLLRLLGRQAQALPWLERASALMPDSYAANSELGFLLDDLGRGAEALPWLEVAARLAPPPSWDAELAAAARADLEARLARLRED